MKVEIKRETEAGQSYGRGMDNRRYYSNYAIIVDGEKVGFIHADSTRQFETAAWTVYRFEKKEDGRMMGRDVRRFYAGGIKRAKEWTIENIEKIFNK